MKDKVYSSGWLCGSAVDLKPAYRVVFTFLFALLAASLCFSQFGIISLGSTVQGDLNLVLLLIPAVLCAALFGFVSGAAVGTITGILLMVRAYWTPTSFFDMFLPEPLLSVVPTAVGSIAMAAVIALGAWRWPSDQSSETSGWKRVSVPRMASIFVGCLLLTLCFSYGGRGALLLDTADTFNVNPNLVKAYMGNMMNPYLFLEAMINAIACTVVCVAIEIVDANRRAGSWANDMSSVFSLWLFFSMVFVFMIASAASFCIETVRADRETSQMLNAELDYIEQQIAYRQAQDAPINNLLDGYTADCNGTVAAVRDYVVVTSNNPEFDGKPVVGTFVESEAEFDALAADSSQFTAYESDSRSFVVMEFRVFSDYVLFAYMPLPATYINRTSTLLNNAVFFLVMFAVVFIAARRLLRGVVVAPIHRTNDTLELITGGDLRKRVDEHGVVEFTALSNGINSTVSALKGTIAEVEQRNAQDLATAKAIQESALPREFPPFPDIDMFDIYASMKTAKEVGGDFYDFFLIENDATSAPVLGFVMADVSGKGIPAALFMMTAKTQIRNYMESGLPVDEAVVAANHQLCIANDAGMFVTMWVGVLDYGTGMMSFVNAGHNPPMLLHEGKWEWIKDTSGMPLGLFDGIPYERFERKLEAGDMLYAYTDGVTEAMDVDGNLFGEARLEATLNEFASFNPRSVGVGVRRAITEFTLDAEQSDDITMLILKYGVPPERKAVMVLPADDKQLIHVYNFIHEELHRRGAPKTVYNPLDIAAEELFVNVCRYAYPDATSENPGEVRISFEYESNPPALTVQIADDGVPYDPLAKPDAVTPDDIADVPIGGLGILMAKRSVDEMSYERVGQSNAVTFKKAW